MNVVSPEVDARQSVLGIACTSARLHPLNKHADFQLGGSQKNQREPQMATLRSQPCLGSERPRVTMGSWGTAARPHSALWSPGLLLHRALGAAARVRAATFLAPAAADFQRERLLRRRLRRRLLLLLRRAAARRAAPFLAPAAAGGSAG